MFVLVSLRYAATRCHTGYDEVDGDAKLASANRKRWVGFSRRIPCRIMLPEETQSQEIALHGTARCLTPGHGRASAY